MSSLPEAAGNDKKGQQFDRGNTRKGPYWSGRFIATNVILMLLALLAAYLEYSVYAAIMTGSPFYESNISLHVSFFSYSYDASRCVGIVTTVSNCLSSGASIQNIQGIPAFDFVQLFVAILIIANLYHSWTFSKR